MEKAKSDKKSNLIHDDQVKNTEMPVMFLELKINHGSWNYSEYQGKNENEVSKITHETANFSYN
ncbi:hypothetical protein [Flexithrix dorotheae]|uniref:hypothetical protein n=1 Tax=Flexithrix dorotheae TaxID=70993 RepID=UPI00036BF50D|nr:hypothetical protein [Flexithrix dorotheae]